MKIDGVPVHKSITPDRLVELMESEDMENHGLCILCGEIADGVEPDAEKYLCPSCHCSTVYGIEDLLIRIP